MTEHPGPETAATGRSRELEKYVEGLFAQEDPVLREVRSATVDRGFPVIHVPPVTGRALQVLVVAAGARRILEVGTLTGYSAIWMGRALPEDGRMVTLEADPAAADVARRFLARAELDERVEVREGRAERLLPEMGPDGNWDVVFLDADKEGMVGYAHEAARLLRTGGLLLADNALWKGRVVPSGQAGMEDDPDTRAVLEFNRTMAADERFVTTILPVGDGILTAVRR